MDQQDSRSPNHCREFDEQGDCLLQPGKRHDWSCQVCRSVEGWKSAGFSVALVREIIDHRGLYAFPADVENLPTGPEASDCLMQISLQNTDSHNIRAAFQTILTAAEQAWVAQKDRSTRLK